MTTGEYLVSHSTLSSGTALQHLLALQIGSGQGTVFCSQFNVRIEHPEQVITRKAKRSAAPEAAPVARTPITYPQQKHISVFHSVPTMTVFDSGPEQLVVTRKRR
jgi:hypothetical protein